MVRRSTLALVLALLPASCAGRASVTDDHGRLGPALDVTRELTRAIDDGDLDRARVALCAAYAAGDMPCAETLRLEWLAATDVMSGVDLETHVVHMQPVPPRGGGLAYWDNWSAVLAGGAWRPRALFTDDDDARRMATVLLVTVLAHELGHHVATAHRCNPGGAAGELRADELSTPLVREVMRGPLAPLHARVRRIADAMIAAVPADQRVEVPPDVDLRAWVADHALPDAPAAYASLHLSRERRVLADPTPFGAVARRLCLDAFDARLAGRVLVPTTVSTSGTYAEADAVFAIDRTGAVWSAPVFLDGPGSLVLRRGGDAFPLSPPPGNSFLLALTVYAADRLAYSDGIHVWLLDDGAWRDVGNPVDTEVAFDEAGTAYVATRGDRAWTVAPLGGPPRWRVALDREAADWGDGPLAQAHGFPTLPAIDGDRLLFFDRARQALRRVDATSIVTLAGGREGRHDGPGADARFFAVSGVQPLADGSIAIVEGVSDRVTVRRIVAAP